MRSLPEHASQPPAQDAEALDRAGFPVCAHEPRVLSALLATAQARVRATGRELDGNDLATLLAQESALAGATVERGDYGELTINLPDGEPWATLTPDGRLDWVAPNVPVPTTPPLDSAAFARGRQQFKASVALLARRERRLLDRPTRCRGARPRAVRFKPRCGARRAARRGATRAGPGDDPDSEGEGEPTDALNRLVGVPVGNTPSPARQSPRRSCSHRRLPGRLNRAPLRRPRPGRTDSGSRS